VKEGETVAALGQNGAGKSTIVKILAGVTNLASGRIRLNGADVQFDSSRRAHSAPSHCALSVMTEITGTGNRKRLTRRCYV
jgi:ribose transport system ATP-binding protein